MNDHVIRSTRFRGSHDGSYWTGAGWTADVFQALLVGSDATIDELDYEVVPAGPAMWAVIQPVIDKRDELDSRVETMMAAIPRRDGRALTRDEFKAEKGWDPEGQNRLWNKIHRACRHRWQPVQLGMETELYRISDGYMKPVTRQPDLTSGRCWLVCLKCCAHTYVDTAWAGYYVGSPELLEEAEADRLDREGR